MYFNYILTVLLELGFAFTMYPSRNDHSKPSFRHFPTLELKNVSMDVQNVDTIFGTGLIHFINVAEKFAKQPPV